MTTAAQLHALGNLVDALNELEASGLTLITSTEVCAKTVSYRAGGDPQGVVRRLGILDFYETNTPQYHDVRDDRVWFWNHNETVVSNA